jgi:hypothetical protein
MITGRRLRLARAERAVARRQRQLAALRGVIPLNEAAREELRLRCLALVIARDRAAATVRRLRAAQRPAVTGRAPALGRDGDLPPP